MQINLSSEPESSLPLLSGDQASEKPSFGVTGADEVGLGGALLRIGLRSRAWCSQRWRRRPTPHLVAITFGLARQVARAVDLAVVHDALHDFNFLGHGAKATDFAALLVVLAAVDIGRIERQLDFGQHQMIDFGRRCVSAQHKSLYRVLFVGQGFFVGLHQRRKRAR
jgi:hypothetical protein